MKLKKTELKNTKRTCTSLNHTLVNNQSEAGKKGRISVQLPFEDIFGFCRTFKKITKQLGVHLTLETAELQDIIYATLDDEF